MRPVPATALVLAASLGLPCLSSGCATTGAAARPPAAAGAPEPAVATPAAVMARFVAAVEAGRWPEAYGLLSARWRAGSSPRRLELDFGGAGPVARETAARVSAALAAGAPLSVSDGRATLLVAPGRAAVLVAEAGGWRVDALE
jgi:hypothetical protein